MAVVDPTRASVVVADDYPLYVAGLCRCIEDDARFRLAGVAGDGPGTVELFGELQPDVALVGYFLPHQGATELFQELQMASSRTRIVVLAGIVEADIVHDAVGLGARGFLVKQESGPVVLDALQRVALGETAFSSAAEACLVDAVRARAKDSEALPSPRETQILRLLAKGATSREVAARMYVSEATIKSHLNRLYKKLGVNDRSAAVAQAMRKNWVA